MSVRAFRQAADAAPSAPHLITELPGPRARALIARDDAVTSPSLTRAYPLVAESGDGYVVTDVDDNRFLDFAAGIAVAATGHSHPAVVAAITAQAERLVHIAATDFYEPRYIELSERLAAIAPFEENARVFLTNSGTEAVEGAIKLARHHTGRPAIIAFEGAFHGRTLGALSLTNSKLKQRAGFGPLLPMVFHAPFPRVRSWHEGSGGDGTAELDVLRHSILGRLVAPEDVAAIVFEPIQGEGGYFPAPAAFIRGLRQICDEHGIVLIADEIQSGMGRTGRMWAMEAYDVEPDVVTVAKGIASGMPLGAMIARRSVMTWKPGAHGNTFGGNPVSCAAALATIDVIERESLLEHADAIGEYILDALAEMQARHPTIGDVRGKGLMIGVEFVLDKRTKEPAHDLAEDITQRGFQKGLLLLPAGVSTIRLSPALNIPKELVDEALEVFEEALSEAEAAL